MAEADDDRVFFFLDSPKYHRVLFGQPNRFAGMIFDSRDVRVVRVGASFDGGETSGFPADLPSGDIARSVPHLASAGRCRFDFELSVPEGARVLALEALDGSDRPMARLDYDFGLVRAKADSLRAMSRVLAEIPAPPPEIVFLTQGHPDAFAYQESIIPGIVNQRRYLGSSGAPAAEIRSVLDLGCGSGRSLLGWYLDDPSRDLVGCDIREDLIGWARENLPRALRFEQTALEPPLPYPARSFDLVDLISVFTHLSFPAQRRWAREIGRVLRPGGIVCVTAHGLPYVHLFCPDRREEFLRIGHFELQTASEGSNDCASFHSPGAMRELFPDLDLLAHFPSGRIDGKRMLFPLAALQDVYVLRKRS